MNNNENLIPLNSNPISLFDKWFDLAKKNEVNDPNAMGLTTISNDGKPSLRIVLLKSFSEKGFVFYTNSESKKGVAISYNKFVALNFYWKSIKKQIRIEGTASLISDKESDNYFRSRPTLSKISAWASSQSSTLSNRSELIDKTEKLKIKYINKNIPRPPYWNGYLVEPESIEFWQEMAYRLHDRVEYKRNSNGWLSKKLYP